MNKQKITRIAMIVCSLALACMTMVMGVTYALLTEKVTVKNHLNSGNLNLTLYRTALEYRVLNDDGEFEITTINDTPKPEDKGMNFTEPTDEGIFGIKEGYEDIVIAPGSYFAATMALYNEGSIAFDYKINLDLIGDVNELAEQLQVTITYPDNPERAQQIKMLSELTGTGNSLVIDEGHMTPGQDKMAFTVRVTFVTDENNNDAINQEVEFDLTVSAVQTEKTVTPGANN